MSTVTFDGPSIMPSTSGVMDAADRVKQAANQQMAWNRPNTANPWAAQTSNPDGSVSLGFTGPLQGAQQNLTAQALRSLGTPTDYTQFNSGSGDDFRNQGIAGAQSQMNDWLGPLQGGIDDASKQRLLNAGYQEGSPQFQAQMAKGAGTSADLSSSVHNAAIGIGGQLGAKEQAMDMLSKQQGLAEALRKRSLPMEQLADMQGLLSQPQHSGDSSIMAGATGDLSQYLNNYMSKRQAYQAQNQADQTAGLNMGMNLFQTAGSLGMNGMGAFNKSGASEPAPASNYWSGASYT